MTDPDETTCVEVESPPDADRTTIPAPAPKSSAPPEPIALGQPPPPWLTEFRGWLADSLVRQQQEIAELVDGRLDPVRSQLVRIERNVDFIVHELQRANKRRNFEPEVDSELDAIHAAMQERPSNGE